MHFIIHSYIHNIPPLGFRAGSNPNLYLIDTTKSKPNKTHLFLVHNIIAEHNQTRADFITYIHVSSVAPKETHATTC